MSLPSHPALAKKAYQKGQWSLAFSHALWAQHLHPLEPSSLYVLATLYLKKNQGQAALNCLKQAPIDQAFTVLKVKALLLLGRELEALTASKQLAKNGEATKEAIEKRLEIKEAIQKTSMPLKEVFALFDQCMEQHLYQEAMDLVTLHNQPFVNPENQGRLYYRLGLALFKMQDFFKALKAFEKAKFFKPEAIAIDYYLGLIHYRHNDINNSLYFFQKVLKKDPHYYSLPLNLSKLYLCKGWFSQGWYQDTCRQLKGNDLNFVKDSSWYSTCQSPVFSPPSLASLKGTCLSIKGQEGLGDQCFYLRFVPSLLKKGIEVLLYLDPRLIALLPASIASKCRPLFPKEKKTKKALLLNHLPRLLKASNYPPSLSFTPCIKALEEVHSLIKGYPAPFMGLQWRAGAFCKKDPRGVGVIKEVSLPSLAKALEGFSGTFVNLQYAPYPEEVAFLHRQFPGRVLDLYPLHQELEKLLAVLFCLDEYTAVSNTCIHFREGMGKKSRVLIPRPWEWRWWGRQGKLYAFQHCLPYYQSSLGEGRESWQKTWNALSSEITGA